MMQEHTQYADNLNRTMQTRSIVSRQLNNKKWYRDVQSKNSRLTESALSASILSNTRHQRLETDCL